MTHSQKTMVCSYCKRMITADIVSYGTVHQEIIAMTCRQCGLENGARFLNEGEVEEIDTNVERS